MASDLIYEHEDCGETYQLTPKGILLALCTQYFLIDVEDKRDMAIFNGMWEEFENDMRRNGYYADDKGE